MESNSKVDPLEFFTPNRFDLIFKLIFGEAIVRGSNSSYPREIYKKHLFSVTGKNGKFIEYGNLPKKAGLDQFVQTFRSLLSGEVESFPPVQIDSNFCLNNGAHRVVAAYLHHKLISVQVEKKSRNIKADYSFFLRANRYRYRIKQEDIDYGLLRFATIDPRTQILVVFPSMRSKALIKELRSQKSFYLERKFRLNPIAKRKLLDILYPKASNFVNLNSENNQNAFRDRFNAPGKLRVFFFENNDVNFVLNLKESLRKKFHLLNGTIHSPDDFYEYSHLLQILLVKNSRKNLHRINLQYAQQMSERMEILQSFASDSLVVGSGTLALLGVRESRDLDLVFYENSIPKKNSSVDIHNSYWRTKGFNVDELIDNPKDFVLVLGVKYISLTKLVRFKLNRRERKDAIDILLLFRGKIKSISLLLIIVRHAFTGYLRLIRNRFRNPAK